MKLNAKQLKAQKCFYRGSPKQRLGEPRDQVMINFCPLHPSPTPHSRDLGKQVTNYNWNSNYMVYSAVFESGRQRSNHVN